MRGFHTEIHYAKTRDGYYLNLVRIINPKNNDEYGVFKRPVIFNHGLLSSAAIWVISSRDVRPQTPPKQCFRFSRNSANSNNSSSVKESDFDNADPLYVSGPFMLANYGYDVWLLSMRGTDFSLRHNNLSPKDHQFWNYSLDDFALIDVPTAVDYVRKKTRSPKVGYVGHSQATFSIFGLLSIRPHYADVIEPVVAVAPVSYFDHITSAGSMATFIAISKATSEDKHGPFPPDARNVRKAMLKMCKDKLEDLVCQLMTIFSQGSGREVLKGHFTHMPYYTSLKVMRHFGQLITTKRNTMYNYDKEENLRLYGTEEAPSYPTERIRSRSLCLFSTKTDALSPPQDVARFKKRLTVPLYRDIFIDGEFNHMDIIINPKSADMVFKPMLDIFEGFERRTGSCLMETRGSPNGHQYESNNELNNSLENEESENIE